MAPIRVVPQGPERASCAPIRCSPVPASQAALRTNDTNAASTPYARGRARPQLRDRKSDERRSTTDHTNPISHMLRARFEGPGGRLEDMDSDLRDRTTCHQAAASTPANPAGRGRATAALISVCLGFFVIQLDVTIVNVALPAIQHQIGGSLAGLQWVVDAYTLALASIMLTAGSTADRIGARKIFTLGLAAFAVGSAACAAAPQLGVLIAARAVQGLGASAMLPCSLALLVHQFPDPRARARALGVWGGMGSLGVALGPVAGGVLVTATGWRSIFLVNVPICLVTIVLLRRYATESPDNPDRKPDIPGLLLGVTMLAAITASFITAGEQGWLAPLPGALLVTGLITGWL